MKRILIALGLVLGIWSTMEGQGQSVVLATDLNGEVTYGSIDSLIAEIQSGKALRIGWQLDFDRDGKVEIEHWVDAGFISILNGHVFNQIEPIYRQVPNFDKPQIQIITENIQWTGIIGTNGQLISRYVIPDLHLVEDELLKTQLKERTEISERLVATTWVILE